VLPRALSRGAAGREIAGPRAIVIPGGLVSNRPQSPVLPAPCTWLARLGKRATEMASRPGMDSDVPLVVMRFPLVALLSSYQERSSCW